MKKIIVTGHTGFIGSLLVPLLLEQGYEVVGIDTNYFGMERAFVMTEEYEKVLPMDILPVQLLKAIIIKDIDLMENLGIYEVSEEDFALCEFVCTSKINVQEIIREGLDIIYDECM